MMLLRWMFAFLPAIPLAGQTQPSVSIPIRPQVADRPIRDGQVTTVYLAPRYATAIRMPEPVNSVVVGDPGSFSAEHSDREPQMVFLKPITEKPAQSNLLISTTRGLEVNLLLVSRGEPKGDAEAQVDFLMRYKPSGQFLVQPAAAPSAVVPQTVSVANEAVNVPVVSAALGTHSGQEDVMPQTQIRAAKPDSSKQGGTAIDELLDHQRRAPLPKLYGHRTGISPLGHELIRAGVSEVIDQGSTVVVLFSALNAKDHAVELMPPQIQLGGLKKTGTIIRKLR